MTLKEMKEVCEHDVLKYVGPSLGGLIRNKFYTVKEIGNNHIDFFMPKGQSITIDMNDHDLWEMHEAKGAAMAKEARLKSMTAEFYSQMGYVYNSVDDLNVTAEEIDTLLKDFPLDGKMKLLTNLDKGQLEVLEFLHKIRKNKLTTIALVRAFDKRNKNGT
jgi:hypothetical protein